MNDHVYGGRFPRIITPIANKYGIGADCYDWYDDVLRVSFNSVDRHGSDIRVAHEIRMPINQATRMTRKRWEWAVIGVRKRLLRYIAVHRVLEAVKGISLKERTRVFAEVETRIVKGGFK